MSSLDLSFSRNGRKLAAAMSAYAMPRLLPKLQARTNSLSGCNRYDDLSVDFKDACVYLYAWLGYGRVRGMVQFPFARLYPVKGGLYNVSVRRLLDWSRAEDARLDVIFNSFVFQAPSAKFWVKIGEHKTFEECIDLLVEDPCF